MALETEVSTAPDMQFMVQRAEDANFNAVGLRSFLEYRDLGIAAATGGKFHAQVIRAREACSTGTGRHRHGLDFQMVFVLAGELTFFYEGEGEVTLKPGDCVHQPPGIVHELLRCSSDCMVLEITSPAEFTTEDA